MSHICQNPGCGKPAKLQCPTCLKMKLPSAYFCGKECFTAYWPKHKIIHEVEKYKQEQKLDPIFRGYQFTGEVRPGKQTPQMTVPDSIMKPDYASDPEGRSACEEAENRFAIEIKTPEAIKGMREACKIAREVLDAAGSHVKVGVTGEEIDKIVYEECMKRNVYPSPLNYYKYPKSVCVSVNEIVCHGIPDDRPFEDGDIVNLDVTIYKDGYHGDVNETYLVGHVKEKYVNLVKAAYESLRNAIKHVRPGMKVREIGNYVCDIVEPLGYKPDRHYCGHGIGRLFHCNPTVPHYRNNKGYGTLRAGMTLTIEPMINEGSGDDQMWPDHWTVCTKDGKYSAQFEHTLLVTNNGCEVLTASPLFYKGEHVHELLPFDANMFQR